METSQGNIITNHRIPVHSVKCDGQADNVTFAQIIERSQSSIDDLYINTFNLTKWKVRELLETLSRNTNIKRLELRNITIGPDGIQALLANSTTLSLSSLSLHNNCISCEGGCYLARTLATTTSLSELILSRNRIGNEGAKAISKALATNNTIRKLSLTGCDIPSEGIINLLKALFISNISTLQIRCNPICTSGVNQIAQLLHISKSIKELDLSYCDMSAEGINLIASYLDLNSSLTTLDLSHNEIDSLVSHNLADASLRNSTLSTLLLSNCCLQTIGCNEITSSLTWNASITHLDISSNYIGDVGFETIVGILRRNSTLQKLNLNDNKVSSIDPLLLALKNNTTLTWLGFPDSANQTAPSSIRDCFVTNTTLTGGSKIVDNLIEHFVVLNKVCKDLGAGKASRESVQETLTKDEDVRRFLEALMKGSKEWRAMKAIVLGSGGIGKTTLSYSLQHLLEPSKINKHFSWDSTVGIEYSRLILANGIIGMWDFAGQLQYTVTHQYFLSNEMVVYLVCYDLSSSVTEQRRQILYWLRYLNSLLCDKSRSNPHPNPKWKVIVVGTKLDLHKDGKTIKDTNAWQKLFPNLPLCDDIYKLSSYDEVSISSLLKTMEIECGRILDSHSRQIPTSYRDLLHVIKAHRDNTYIIDQEIITTQHKRWAAGGELQVALRHLHSIGEIVLFGTKICTKPSIVSQIMAKFISPEEVRNSLLRSDSDGISLLSKTDIDAVIGINRFAQSDSLLNELELMGHFGVCFEIPTAEGATNSLYLFPSLGSTGELQFTLDSNSTFHVDGIRATAANNAVFVPGLFCQLVVALCTELNIYKQEIQTVCINGVLLTCPGVMDGQLIVYNEPKDDSQSILFLMMASNPELERVRDVFCKLINTKFPQYVGFTEAKLCPECIKQCFVLGKIPSHKIGVATANRSCAFGHSTQPSLPKPTPLELCWTHGKHNHDFFLSHRVLAEGTKTPNSQKPLVQTIYEHLNRRKRASGDSVYVFWDKKCLYLGENWQKGFMNGLINSTVILLLISVKALEGIRNAATKQDNLLLEFECALIRNKGPQQAHVVPIFVGEEKDKQGKITYERFERPLGEFPNAPHKRSEDATRTITELSRLLPEHKRGFLGSISQTMAQIFQLQGIHLEQRGNDFKELDEVVNSLMKVLNDHSPYRNTPTRARSSPTFSGPNPPSPKLQSTTISYTPAITPNIPNYPLPRSKSKLATSYSPHHSPVITRSPTSPARLSIHLASKLNL